jgi:tRNA-dihydrouridine synthase A
MMDWTDRHCRVFHRLITRRTRLYTEMVTTGALLHGDVPRHLAFDAVEHPLALQLGGSEPDHLAACARLAERWGYDEVNLNCGCPSERVQRGAFGACLMAEPVLVADCVAAMRDACQLPVTVKHRIGIDRQDDYGFVRDFVGTVAERGGCQLFIVHARSAWLQGLSPKQNREIPPLRHETLLLLRRDFPGLRFLTNGGIAGDDAVASHLALADGVMVGRHAYHEPWSMAQWDRSFLGEGSSDTAGPDREAAEAGMVAYLASLAEAGIAWSLAARHMLGLWNGTPGARRWRQVWSDHRLKTLHPREVARQADAARRAAGRAEGAEKASPEPASPASSAAGVRSQALRDLTPGC